MGGPSILSLPWIFPRHFFILPALEMKQNVEENFKKICKVLYKRYKINFATSGSIKLALDIFFLFLSTLCALISSFILILFIEGPRCTAGSKNFADV